MNFPENRLYVRGKQSSILNSFDRAKTSRKLDVDSNDHAECKVSGALALTFRLSQMLAIAPVRFGRRRGALVVSVSPTLSGLTFLFMSVLNTAGLTGLVMDMNVSPNMSVRIPPTSTGKMLWLADFTMVMIIASIAAYGAPTRVREIICCLNRVQEIKKALSNEETKYNAWTERKKYAVFILFLTFGTSLVFADYGRVIDSTLYYGKSVISLGLYAAYDIAFIMMFLLELQFAYSTVELCEVLSSLNNALEQISYKDSLVAFPVPKNPSKTSHETVHRLTSTFAITFDVVKRLDTANGLSLVMLLFSCLLHLVITPNRLIYSLRIGNNDGTITPRPEYMQTTSRMGTAQHMTLDVFFCMLHLLRTVLLIEPPHMTLAEIERTHHLVSNLMLHSTDDVVSEELDKFYKYLLLNKIEYSPLGICSLMRSLLPSMMGSVATYLVIVIQFESLENGV